MDFFWQALTVVGIVLVVLATAVVGPLVLHRVLEAAAELGFFLGARRRLALGEGNWTDADVFVFHQWRRHPEREALLARLSDMVVEATLAAPDPWHPELPGAIHRWVRDGHPGGLLLDAIDAGYDAAALDAHRTGTIVLDAAAVQTMRALRT